MIVRYEVALSSCRQEKHPWCGQQLVVDTGSQQGTVQGAPSLGAEVKSFDDNIASARLLYMSSLVMAKWRLDCIE